MLSLAQLSPSLLFVVVVVIVAVAVVAILLLLLIPETNLESLVKVGLVTAEILLMLSSRWVGGGWWCKVIFMSHPTFVELSWG